MKTPVKRCGLWTAILLASSFAASAIPVTYNVDLSVQIALGNFNPTTDTVFVSGDLSSPNWQYSATDGSTNYILTPNAGNPDIYEGTFDIVNAAASFENHQFVLNPNGDFSNLHWEGGVGNRFFEVPTVATNLPAVYWNDVTNASSLVAGQVFFQVDMTVQTTVGYFNPATDLVLVAGDWNWDGNSAPQLTNNGAKIWSGTVDLTNIPGTVVNYKFLFIPFVGSTTWESAGVGPGGANNRQFAFPNTTTNLDVVYFNNITNATGLVTVPVTFQINMSGMDAYGAFIPGVDTVSVAGDSSLNNWDAAASPLTQDPTNPELYVGTYNVTNNVGTMVNFKYVLNGGLRWENNTVGPGGGQNRQFAVPGAATNLDFVYFDNTNNLGSMTISNGGSQATIRWKPGTRVRLQSTPTLGGAWSDVPDTMGSNSAPVSLNGETLYRLIGP